MHGTYCPRILCFKSQICPRNTSGQNKSRGQWEGIVVKGVENSIDNFARLGREGMRGTDLEIIAMMTES